MKLTKKLQILLQKNIKIIISIILIISLNYIIFYLDLFNLNFLNKQDIIDLKTELLEEKEDLNFEEKENLNPEKTQNNNNLYKYLIIASCIALLALIVYYNSGNTQPTTEDIPMFHEILRRENKNLSEEDILFHEMAELNGILFNPLEDEASKKLFFDMAPKESFVDEVDELRAQLVELAKK